MRNKLLIALFFFFVAGSCQTKQEEHVSPKKEKELELKPIAEESNPLDAVVSHYKEMGLVEVNHPDILIDLKYATADNFMGTVLYDTLNVLFLQAEVAERIYKCQHFLDSIHPGYQLKIFDGVRPLQVQREMWEALDSVPPANRGKYVSNPRYGSVHNYGTAVDITICNAKGEELDMGAGYDDFRKIAFPSLEAHFLKTGELSREQYENRKLLRRVMRTQRFYNIPSEWWHFNAFTRLTAESRFEILLNESGAHKKWQSPRLPVDSVSSPVISVDSSIVN